MGEALRSILDQDYPGRLEVVAVDDRSADRTVEIIAGLAVQWPDRLKPLRVDSLPDGWLGKNYALTGAVRGLEKSIFPGVDYRLSMVLLASLLLSLTNVLTFFGVFLARRRAMRLLLGADVLMVVAMYAYGPRVSGPAVSPLYAALRSAYMALARGGIEWRGTFYPLRLLKGDARSG